MNLSSNSGTNELKENLKPVRTKLYVSNFPVNSTRRSLTEFFSKFGQVLECAIMWDKYAFIHYGTMEEAQNAVRRANSMYFMGQKLFIQLSTSKNRQSNNWYQQEAEKLLAKANELNLSQNGNLIETKLYVTNLPEDCDQLELKTLFEQYGEVLECVIMWNHYAFVHFSDFNEAKIALENLHGSVFNGKRLLVQLSTSSNRPLPKCLAFSKSKKSKNDSSLLCCNTHDHDHDHDHDDHHHSNDSLLNHVTNCTTNSNNHDDWIEKLKNGNVPIVSESLSQSEKKSELNKQKFDVSKFFSTIKNECVNLSAAHQASEADFAIKASKQNALNCFDLIPTPPMPIANDSKQDNNDCIKKLIDDINSSLYCAHDTNYVDENKNEKILIDRLNLLKFDLDQDSKLRNLWNNASETDSATSASLVSCSSSSGVSSSSSSGVSSSSSVRSLSPPYSTLSINYLNKNCIFQENMFNSHETFNAKNDRQNLIKHAKKSRCRLVNYLLFPEVKEENFTNITDYNNVLIELIKKNCIID